MTTLSVNTLKNSKFDSSVKFPSGTVIQTKYFSDDKVGFGYGQETNRASSSTNARYDVTNTNYFNGYYWPHKQWGTIVQGDFKVSSELNDVHFFVDCYAGITDNKHMGARITWKYTDVEDTDPIKTIDNNNHVETHDGTECYENSMTGDGGISDSGYTNRPMNIQIVHHINSFASYSNNDKIIPLNFQFIWKPKTTKMLTYQVQVRSRTDASVVNIRPNAATVVSNGGYEAFMVSRFLIQEIQVNE